MLDPALAKQIRFFGLDVDGVLTDNGLEIGEIRGERVEFKRYDIQDGVGFALLRGTEIEVAWVSGRVSASTTLRGRELQISTVLQIPHDSKVSAIEQLLAERGLDWSQMAFMGDDLADIPVLERVALPISPANGRDEVKAICRYVTRASGGHGAVREVVELLLKAREEWGSAVARYMGATEVRA